MRFDSGVSPPVAPLLRPDWADMDRVVAGMSTRAGGVSKAPFDSLNLRRAQVADEGMDDPARVAENQQRFARALGATPVWLNQVHGAEVVRLSSHDMAGGASVHRADASVTSVPGLACCVQVADCLPVLMAAPGGRAVGAAHAGWRGLAAGVLGHCLDALCELASCGPDEVQLWLGPCIGPQAFEVGADVLEAFGASVAPGVAAPGFVAKGDSGRGGGARWLADLPALARRQLQAKGAQRITGGTWCTFGDPSRFFSFRRDRVTGRMAAGIARLG